jgi:FkbM family methyltransferase
VKKEIQTSSLLDERLSIISAAKNAAGLRQRLAALWPELATKSLNEIAIVGSADEGVRLAALCSEFGIAIRAIADDNTTKHSQIIEGCKVTSVDSLSNLPRDLPIIVASHRSLLPVRRLRAMGFLTVAPFMVLQLLDPSNFTPHMFHKGLLEDLSENLDRYRELGLRLADDTSRKVLAAVIAYRMDCDPEALGEVVEWDLYGPNELLEYSNEEVYVDGGAFDGDSIKLFIQRVGGKYSRVLGFEPDPVTFKRLNSNFSNEPRVEPINAGLHKAIGTLRFDDAGTRGSILVESGGIEVPVVALDGILNGERVSYIKMNIEGAEIDALHGGAKSIKQWSPKLAISAYHFADHLWRIPQTISEIRPDYKLYFRQHDGGIIETVVFAFPEKA